MATRHFLNLTNGLEALPALRAAGIEDYAFLRIQSTACEQKRWDALIADLDNHFLMCLALGDTCIVHDYSNKGEVSRALWQGLEFVRFCLERTWFGRDYAVDPSMHPYFEQVSRELRPTSRHKLKYFRKWLLTSELSLKVKAGRTTHDGDAAFYQNLLRSIKMQAAEGGSSAACVGSLSG